MRLKDTACASTQRRIQRKAANSYGSELREARLRGPGQQVRLALGLTLGRLGLLVSSRRCCGRLGCGY